MADKKLLAINGGPKAVATDPGDIFDWPIVTKEDEEAVLDVLRRRAMSANEITRQFEKEWADYCGVKHALTFNNGTESLRSAMWALGVGLGDEIVCPATTYWASAAPALALGATVNFCDIDPDTLCLDVNDIEHRVGPRTKLIVAVHYAGYPADMDAVMAIAKKHGLKVLEDASHAHGGVSNGRMVGTIGDAGAMSMMSGKSFAIGEAGMMMTNDREVYERSVAYGFYERTRAQTNFTEGAPEITMDELKPYAGAPIGTFKHRLNQTCAAMGRVQLKYYPERNAEILRAMNRFWDLLEGVPGIRAHRPPKGSNSQMGGWYSARGLYRADELGGLPCAKFCEAVRAEGVGRCHPGANKALHLHPLFTEADLFNMGKPTAIAFGQRDVRQGSGSLPVSERIDEICFGIPWFKHDRPEIIEEHAAAYRKVCENAKELL